jgi:phosphomevalonate kinase
MKKIILISGKSEAGKDTLALYLKEQLENKGQRVIIDRFAKFIKGYLRDYYSWDGISKDEHWREKIQLLGTDKIKEQLNYKSFHARRLAEDFQIVADDFDYMIVSDTRFRDEIHTMKAMFPDECISVRINRYDHQNKLTEEQRKHKSECDLDNFKFDYVIHTRKSSIGQLHDEADRVLKSVLEY